MKKMHWQDWIILVVALWVIVSPWTIEHLMATPESPLGVSEAAMWNHYVVGVVAAVAAAVALFVFNVWEEWLVLALGAWLFVSPWLLGFSESSGLMWNAIVTGTLLVIFAGWVLGEEQGSKTMAG